MACHGATRSLGIAPAVPWPYCHCGSRPVTGHETLRSTVPYSVRLTGPGPLIAPVASTRRWLKPHGPLVALIVSHGTTEAAQPLLLTPPRVSNTSF